MVSDLFGAFCGRKSSCGHFAGAEEMDRKAVFAHMAICALGRCSAGDGGACFRESACPCAAPTGKQVVQTVPLPAEQTMTEQPAPVDTVEAPAGEILPFTEETALPPVPWWDVLAVLWVLGALGSLGYRLTGYFRFGRYIRRTGKPMELAGVPKRLRVCKTSAAVSPMVMGMIRPVLILPETALTESRLPYVLRHELVHYRRGDIFWRWLAVLATSIHWFNPMVYVAAAQMQEACEISCDWCVVRSMEQAKRDDYMRVILELLAEAMAKNRF